MHTHAKKHKDFLFSFLIYSFLFSSYYNITCNTFTWYMFILLYNLSFLNKFFIFIILIVILCSINKYI